jgi:hypothetical protein
MHNGDKNENAKGYYEREREAHAMNFWHCVPGSIPEHDYCVRGRFVVTRRQPGTPGVS